MTAYHFTCTLLQRPTAAECPLPLFGKKRVSRAFRRACVWVGLGSLSLTAYAQTSEQNPELVTKVQSSKSSATAPTTRVYVFFDENHSYVQQDDQLVQTNFITTPVDFSKSKSISIFGSEHFCQNMFYLSDKKIIFYNMSPRMSSYVWCQIQFNGRKNQPLAYYRFILNRTFSSWCRDKDTNLGIGRTVTAILNVSGHRSCTGGIVPMLAKTRILNLSNMHIEDVSPVAGLLQVRSLWLDNNDIEVLEPLGAMHNVMFLSLNNNYIYNAKSLNEMKGLRWVFLNNNQIIKVDFLTSLKTLKFLGIQNNLIADPTPLYEASPSTYILANNNPFTKSFCKKHPHTGKEAILMRSCEDHKETPKTPNSPNQPTASGPTKPIQ